jgi:hypothetical protein
MTANKELPTFSLVLEWENARLSELGRTQEMLKRLHEQIVEVEHPRPEIIILHDKDHVERRLIEEVVGKVSKLETWPADIRIFPTDGLGYYEQKNFGAQQSDSDLIIFIDSDVIPEPGWLANLLEAFQNPDVKVVWGNTYITQERFYDRAFALFWFFPLRSDEEGLRRADYVLANNLAFRRETFEAFQFPSLPLFRGQCGALTENLKKHGIDIFCQPGARVSHPPPNGLRHFVTRAVCEGYDVALYRQHVQGRAASPVASLTYHLRTFGRRSLTRTVRHYRDVRLGPIGAFGAIGIAACYCVFGFAGALLAHVQPELVRRHFSI